MQSLREMFRDDFSSALLLVIVGTVALIFVLYLALDYFWFGIKKSHHKKKSHKKNQDNQ